MGLTDSNRTAHNFMRVLGASAGLAEGGPAPYRAGAQHADHLGRAAACRTPASGLCLLP